MDAQPVFLRVNGHGAQAQFRRRAKNADGDFVAIGDQQPFGRPDGAAEGEDWLP